MSKADVIEIEGTVVEKLPNNNATCFFFIRKTLLFLDLSVLKKAPCKM